MDERRKHIDEFFRREMGRQAEAPPAAVWEALEKRLDENDRRKRPVAIWWFFGIGSIILLSATAIIAGLIIDSRNSHIAKTTAPKQEHTTASRPIVTIAENNNGNKATTPATRPAGIAADNDIVQNTPPHTTTGVADAPAKSRSANTNITNKETTSIDNNSTPTGQPGNTPQPANLLQHTAQYEIGTGSRYMHNKMQPVHLPDIKVYPPADAITSAADIIPAGLPELTSVAEQPAVTPGLVASIGNKGIAIPHATPKYNADNLLPLPGMQLAAVDSPDKDRFSFIKDTSGTLLDDTQPEVITTKKKPMIFEAGVKAGYVKGFDKWRADKWMIAPYVAYKPSKKVTVVFQPSYQSGNARTGQFPGGEKAYYELQGDFFDSVSRVVRGVIDSSILTPNPPDTVYYTYNYRQNYDSVHVSYGVSQTSMWDVELPLMVQYRLSKTFSIVVGASATYSSVLETKETVTRYSGLSQQQTQQHPGQTYYVTVQNQPPPPGPAKVPFSSLFSYNIDPFSSYTPRTISSTRNFFRYGFMIGASANITDRWMVDLLLHKTGVNTSAVPDKNLQRIYTQPYLRLTIGYKLFNNE